MSHQAVWRRRSEVGEEEVDPLFWGRDGHYFLCGAERLRPGAAWGRDHGKDRLQPDALLSRPVDLTEEEE